MGGREIRIEGNFKGGTLRRRLASILYTAHKTTHNAALAIATLVYYKYKIVNGYINSVLWCVIMYCFDRWMT